MRKSREYILSGNIESLEYYTSGWAIVWYVLDPDKMIILGSREVCGLNKILIDFKKNITLKSYREKSTSDSWFIGTIRGLSRE